MFNECSSSSSMRSGRGNKLRSSISCFRTNPEEAPAVVSLDGQRTPRSPYAWLKSTAHDLEIRDRCRRVKARIKGSRRSNCSYQHYYHHRQNHGSGDFSYDPLSYALNFEDDVRAPDEDESYPRFTARLPATPKRKTEPAPANVLVSREIIQVC